MSSTSPTADDEHQLTHVFRIAGISLVLKFLPDTLMPISEALVPYQVDIDTVSGRPTVVQFIQDAPDLLAYNKGLEPTRPSINVSRLGDKWLFTCHTGQFLASSDFTSIELWAPFERTISDVYDGYPLLMLVLWGRLSLMGGCYLHGAIVVIQGKYVLLLGDSGVGKSTLSGCAVEQGFTCLTDEDPWLTWENEQPCVHSFPWPGVKGLPQSTTGALSAIFFLRHATRNTLHLLEPKEAGRRLLGNARMFNWIPETIPDAVGLLDKTLNSVPVYDFGFLPEAGAVEMIREVL